MEKINNIKNIDEAKLEKPSSLYKDSFIDAMKEFLAEGYNSSITEGKLTEKDIKDFEENFNIYLTKIEEREKGINLPENYVISSMLWLIDNKEFIGRISIRHRLNDKLSQIGGHIGYAIRPTKRKMGYGSKILDLGLVEAKKLGLDKVLITCDDDNIGSWKIIEKNGGILENKIEEDNELKRRYWVSIK